MHAAVLDGHASLALIRPYKSDDFERNANL